MNLGMAMLMLGMAIFSTPMILFIKESDVYSDIQSWLMDKHIQFIQTMQSMMIGGLGLMFSGVFLWGYFLQKMIDNGF